MAFYFGRRHEYEEIGGATDGPWRLRRPGLQTLVVTAVVLVVTLMEGAGLLSCSTSGCRPFSSLPLFDASIVTGVVLEIPEVLPPTKEEEAGKEDFSKETYEERYRRCKGVDWQQACDRLEGAAGARRRLLSVEDEEETFSDLEEDYLLDADDSSASYDEKCLRVYRLDLLGNTTFPYQANQLLRAGGNQTIALFIQHGAMRDADNYFCSFRKLMLEQDNRPFKDILVIAPDFNYERDEGVLSTDAFWNGSKPWGDWRVGAESTPSCCGGIQTGTMSSFSVLDHMLGILTEKKLYPNLNKISYVGHSAGGQMVQRYALLSKLAASYDFPSSRIDMEFIVANPSSYTYMDNRRFAYNCGDCHCTRMNCTCDKDCTQPSAQLSVPKRHATRRNKWACFDRKYNHWPYGVEMVKGEKGMYSIPYAIHAGLQQRLKEYKHRHVAYMVGQNDTCNDGLPTCDQSCWKREDFLPGEWPCYRNHMDSRCPAMLEGPNRRTRGMRYLKYLEAYYGTKTHLLHIVPGVGHNATAMFGSAIGLQELFD